MRLISGGATLLVLGALLGSALPADDKTSDKTDKTTEKTDKSDIDKPAAKAKKEKFEYSTKFDAKLTKLEGSTKNFSVQIAYAVPDPQRVVDNQNHYARTLSDISRDRDARSRARRLAELQLDMQKRAANSLVKKTKDVDLEADEKLKVRMVQPPTEFDDKGNPKKLTKAELKALKGPDPTLPGYLAEFEQLRVGQQVVVYLAKVKQEKGKAAKKNDEPEVDVMRPKAVMVLIVADPPPE